MSFFHLAPSRFIYVVACVSEFHFLMFFLLLLTSISFCVSIHLSINIWVASSEMTISGLIKIHSRHFQESSPLLLNKRGIRLTLVWISVLFYCVCIFRSWCLTATDFYLEVRMPTWPGAYKSLGPLTVFIWGPDTPEKWHLIVLAFWAIVTRPGPEVPFWGTPSLREDFLGACGDTCAFPLHHWDLQTVLIR